SHAFSEITGKPANYPPSEHSHAISEIENLLDELKAKIRNVNGRLPGVNGRDDISKADIGLPNVDNTSDANKPISTATAAALSGKTLARSSHAFSEITGKPANYPPSEHSHSISEIEEERESVKEGMRNVNGRLPGVNGRVDISKADIGLPNVDNTSDANKPISTATAAALSGKAPASHSHAFSEITGKPANYPPSEHSHSISEIE